MLIQSTELTQISALAHALICMCAYIFKTVRKVNNVLII